MTDLSSVAQIMASAVALMSALVACLSVYFAYKGRHNQFRQVVYGRQMDAYFDIMESMSNLFTAAEHTLTISNPLLKGEEGRARFRASLREEHERFIASVNRALIVLPSRVKAAVEHFNEALLAISEPPGERPAAQQPAAASPPPPPGEGLARAYGRAVNCIRHHLAVDSLTTGLLNEMGIGSDSVSVKGKGLRSGVNPLVPVGRKGR
jgi:hypothetical protein